jgi:hypothetical protein
MLRRSGRALEKDRARWIMQKIYLRFSKVYLPLKFRIYFLLGIGQESPLQQHAAPFLLLQQAWAFLPRLFFLQQDMFLSPALQQSLMSQHASAV